MVFLLPTTPDPADGGCAFVDCVCPRHDESATVCQHKFVSTNVTTAAPLISEGFGITGPVTSSAASTTRDTPQQYFFSGHGETMRSRRKTLFKSSGPSRLNRPHWRRNRLLQLGLVFFVAEGLGSPAHEEVGEARARFVGQEEERPSLPRSRRDGQGSSVSPQKREKVKRV